jgi:hypothetical protein
MLELTKEEKILLVKTIELIYGNSVQSLTISEKESLLDIRVKMNNSF